MLRLFAQFCGAWSRVLLRAAQAQLCAQQAVLGSLQLKVRASTLARWHIRAQAPAHRHACFHRHMRVHASACAQSCAPTCTNTPVHKNARAHARTHARAGPVVEPDHAGAIARASTAGAISRADDDRSHHTRPVARAYDTSPVCDTDHPSADPADSQVCDASPPNTSLCCFPLLTTFV